MSEEQGPSVHEISGWRELLDGMGQLTVAWQAIEQSRAEASGEGHDIALPPELLVSLTRAAQDAAESLAGLAELLPADGTDSALLDAQREAAVRWADAHDNMRG
ncbi:MAG: hypothetical protein ACR2FQ_12980 [Pseudonocardiaceae bacterium]